MSLRRCPVVTKPQVFNINIVLLKLFSLQGRLVGLTACECEEMVWVELRVSDCQKVIPQVPVYDTCGKTRFGTKHNIAPYSELIYYILNHFQHFDTG